MYIITGQYLNKKPFETSFHYSLNDTIEEMEEQVEVDVSKCVVEDDNGKVIFDFAKTCPTKYDMKVGARFTYVSNYRGRVTVTCRTLSDGRFPVAYFNNGHEAQWNGNAWEMSGLGRVLQYGDSMETKSMNEGSDTMTKKQLLRANGGYILKYSFPKSDNTYVQGHRYVRTLESQPTDSSRVITQWTINSTEMRLVKMVIDGKEVHDLTTIPYLDSSVLRYYEVVN